MKRRIVTFMLSSISLQLNAFSQVVSPNIRIHPNPSVQQHETSIAVHPSNPNIVLATSIAIDTAVSRARLGWYYTTNSGITWTGGDTLPTHTDLTLPMADPAVAIDLDGNLLIGSFHGTVGSRDVMVARSTDGGIWSLSLD